MFEVEICTYRLPHGARRVRAQPTMQAAERSARVLCRIYSAPVHIWQLPVDPRAKGARSCLLATATQDALGRVWTDLTQHGARLL